MNSPKFSLLSQGLEEVLSGRVEEANRVLASLRSRLDVDAHPEDMQYLIFAAALSRRVGGGTAVEEFNLYRRRFEQSQIDLFNLLASRLPLASMAGTIANEMLTGFIRGHDTVTLLDVGIGKGRQEVALLDRLAEVGALPRQFNFFAVEPSQDSLNAAREGLSAAARRLGLVLNFHGFAGVAEEMTEEHWGVLRGLPGLRLATASFAMHHIAESATGADPREDFFHRMAAWAPAGLVLCEPCSNHHRANVRERFHNSWRHFFYTFQLLDELDIPRQEKNTIKLFFSREVEDIVGTVEDLRRSERHEHVEAWLGRLRRTGFQLSEGLDRAWPASHPAVAIRARPGYVGLDYRDETIVAVICATGPRSAA